MKTGFNTVLFGGHPLVDAMRWAAVLGYDGVELSAIPSMGAHLELDHWADQVDEIRGLAAAQGLELLAVEQPSQDPALMREAFAACAALGIPVVNCGPGGKSGDAESLKESIRSLQSLADLAQRFGVSLCVKAHVGAAIWNTPTTLEALAAIDSPAFGLDFDPSHVHRAGEDAVDALHAVLPRIRHVHIRDCKGREQGPGKPEEQVNGRGEIDLFALVKLLEDVGYEGAVNLEVIGAKDYSIEQCVAIAAEARGHLRACGQATRTPVAQA